VGCCVEDSDIFQGGGIMSTPRLDSTCYLQTQMTKKRYDFDVRTQRRFVHSCSFVFFQTNLSFYFRCECRDINVKDHHVLTFFFWFRSFIKFQLKWTFYMHVYLLDVVIFPFCVCVCFFLCCLFIWFLHFIVILNVFKFIFILFKLC
jgi:hypothetical protein